MATKQPKRIKRDRTVEAGDTQVYKNGKWVSGTTAPTKPTNKKTTKSK